MSDGHLVTARKDHQCTLCQKRIRKGFQYWYEKITPWDHPDNDGYSVFKAHKRCIKAWFRVGAESDWEFFDDPGYWQEVLVYGWLDEKRAA